MEPGEYETIERVEDIHWWYRGMAAISLALLANSLASSLQFSNKQLRILDAGCGPGGMLPHLARFGSPIGVDFHPLAVQISKQKRHAPVARASIERLPFVDSCFQIVTSFDVLYHLAVRDDQRALTEFYRVLEPGGVLLVRVPALEVLRGAHDRYVHTRERYSASELAKKVHAAGFNLTRLTYANFFLLPLIFLQRRLQSDTLTASDVELPHPIINTILENLLLLERWLISFVSFPLGVSLFALARKPGVPHEA